MSDPGPDSSEPTWEVLLAPTVEPREDPAPYSPPTRDSLEPRRLRLIPWPMVPIALGLTAMLVLAASFVVGASEMNLVKAITATLLLLLCTPFPWYRVLFAPRLTLDAEGLTFTTFGFGRDEITLVWSEIEAVQLKSERTGVGNNLTLSLKTTSPTAAAARHGRRGMTDLDLPLGMAGFGRVDRALRRYCRCDYASSHWG